MRLPGLPGKTSGPFHRLDGDSEMDFRTENGRTVFDNGQVRLWRCPICEWWRDWCLDRCCTCGTLRDSDHGKAGTWQEQGAPAQPEIAASSKNRLVRGASA